MWIENHGISRSIRLDQAKCLVGNEAPVNDHCAIGLVGRLIQTIKSRLACIKEEKLANNAFHVKYALM